MKLFKSLLVAPATLGLLAPMSANASEVNFNAISNYSDEIIEIDSNSFKSNSNINPLISGGEGLVDSFDNDGGFSTTTAASFSVDAVFGAVDGAVPFFDAEGNEVVVGEAASFDYQFNIGLTTSFTGEDSLDIAIDNGSEDPNASGIAMGFDTGTGLTVDGVTYTFPLGAATMVVGDSTDISATFTGACAYSSFTDYMGNCGTGNSVGVGGAGVTATMGYAFDSGFSLAGGISSPQSAIMTEESADIFALEAAYTADTYGVALAYATNDGAADDETTYWGLNASYTPENTSFPSISAGYETEDDGTDASGYFVGLTWSEVGPGSVSLGAGTTGNFGDDETETLIYEAAYSYPVNDGMTITPGVFITEVDGSDDLTGILVKTSFSF